MSPVYTAKDRNDVSNADALWSEIVESSSDGSYWHLRTTFDFNFSAGQERQVRDHSFFIYEDDRPVGLALMTTIDTLIAGRTVRAAQFYSGPSGITPWPCVRDDAQDKEKAERFAFEELERRARFAGAKHIRVRLTTPFAREDDRERIEDIARSHAYVHTRLPFSTIDIVEDGRLTPEDRAHRYYRATRTNFLKFADLFECRVVEGKELTSELEELFFELHVKDAGRQTRSRESFQKQADCARHGEGFYVMATEKATGSVVGRLLVSLYKGNAIDNSLAVEPEFQKQGVGQLLKLKAVEELIARNAQTYELGIREDPPSLMRLPTEKDWGLSHFKKGWASGHERDVWELEKFLDADLLHASLQTKEHMLRTYFNLD